LPWPVTRWKELVRSHHRGERFEAPLSFPKDKPDIIIADVMIRSWEQDGKVDRENENAGRYLSASVV
jgi:hypothetical protein